MQLAVGPEWLHLDLTLEGWAADGLLALFFFVAGLELKRELIVGELSDRRAAALPVFAALGGMIAPALVALAVSGGQAAEDGAWAIPVATDIAFALGVLAVIGSALPSGVRILLLSIAVVDDFLAIAMIAILFTADLSFGWLLGGLVGCLTYRGLIEIRLDRAALLILVALAVWICVHASGVHATVAGIALAFATPVRPRTTDRRALGERFEHKLHPLSAGIAVPIFAVGAAGVPLAALGDAVTDRVAIAVFFGLLVGKFVGVLGGARLAVRLGLGSLPPKVSWRDVTPVAVLAGVGYTVSLLISQLALEDAAAQERAAAAVLLASAVASVAALVLLRRREPDLE